MNFFLSPESQAVEITKVAQSADGPSLMFATATANVFNRLYPWTISSVLELLRHTLSVRAVVASPMGDNEKKGLPRSWCMIWLLPINSAVQRPPQKC